MQNKAKRKPRSNRVASDNGLGLRDHEADVLNALRNMTESYPDMWFPPMDVGGSDASHHSATLRKLVRLGLAEKREWGGHIKCSYRYRATPNGIELTGAASPRPNERSE